MNEIKVGYTRVSTLEQDLTVQREALARLGVDTASIYVDHGMTGTNRASPGLREALPAVRRGDTLVATKLDRLARSLKDARDIADELTLKGVVLSLGGSVYDPTDPVGHLLFNVLGMVAEFESDLIRMRTREGMAIARAKGRLRGKQPKLSRTAKSSLRPPRRSGVHPDRDRRTLQRLASDDLPRSPATSRLRALVIQVLGRRGLRSAEERLPSRDRWSRNPTLGHGQTFVPTKV